MDTAAKVITCKRKFDHFTPVLIELHWFPVHQRTVFKILWNTFKALYSVTPTYLNELTYLFRQAYFKTFLNVSGFISQLVRASHRYREVTGSNPAEVLNFSGFYIRSCINCVHNCEDRSVLDFTSTVQHMKYFIYNFTYIY